MTQYQRNPAHDMQMFPAPLDIPWHLIAPEWTYAAMDGDMSVWFYTGEPCKHEILDQWMDTSGIVALCPLIINTEWIDWENSLTFRPECQ